VYAQRYNVAALKWFEDSKANDHEIRRARMASTLLVFAYRLGERGA
jgi:hypothetical protein